MAHQALHKLSVKTATWAAHAELQELARQSSERQTEAAHDQPLAGEELLAGDRRQYTQIGRIRHASIFQPLAEYVHDIRFVYDRAARAPFGNLRKLARVLSEIRCRASQTRMAQRSTLFI